MDRRDKIDSNWRRRPGGIIRLQGGGIIPESRGGIIPLQTGVSVGLGNLALALGGRSAAGLARPLMMPVSNDTLLRVVRRYRRLSPPARNVSGIDDWAWRRKTNLRP